MYYRYQVTRAAHQLHFVRLKETHLFGCNVGEIPRLLRQQLDETKTEPHPWHLAVETTLAQEGETIIIDLKPNNKDRKASLSLYELRDVWGFSAYGWTPGMLRLRGISIDGQPVISDPTEFTVEPISENDSVYTFLHFDGTIRAGSLVGPWTAPRASSTNSALLWPYAMSYFVGEVRNTTPDFLEPRPI